ncbi:hypothetical protein A0J61_11760 [Choanephora cucurbitarum]|uniref:Retrotransposon gag domain-containing protein n=1 Tax=Choanephora cucurbitarum TaxID=101091 RepID=A0A1C7MTI9_9FUNG|nr:hypothetical protein A0J61_11760 [Choanephora cucurbitarum]
MSTDIDKKVSSQDEINSFSALLAEQRANGAMLIEPFERGQDISNWVRQFHLACKAIGLSERSRSIQMLKYLPKDAAAWLVRVVDLSNADAVKEKLLSVYQVDPHVQKSLCRRRLEQLKQGTSRVAEFRTMFETIVSDFPTEHTLGEDILRHIFFSNLRPELRNALLGVISPEDTWRTLAAQAEIRESVLFLGNDHFLQATKSVPQSNDPMELDAFHQQQNCRRVQNHPNPRWVAPGVLICEPEQQPQ